MNVDYEVLNKTVMEAVTIGQWSKIDIGIGLDNSNSNTSSLEVQIKLYGSITNYDTETLSQTVIRKKIREAVKAIEGLQSVGFCILFDWR